jgi:hypothetical protein
LIKSFVAVLHTMLLMSGSNQLSALPLVEFISKFPESVEVQDFAVGVIDPFDTEFTSFDMSDANVDIWSKYHGFLAKAASQEPLISGKLAILFAAAPYACKILRCASELRRLCSVDALGTADLVTRSIADVLKAAYTIEDVCHNFFEEVSKDDCRQTSIAACFRFQVLNPSSKDQVGHRLSWSIVARGWHVIISRNFENWFSPIESLRPSLWAGGFRNVLCTHIHEST